MRIIDTPIKVQLKRHKRAIRHKTKQKVKNKKRSFASSSYIIAPKVFTLANNENRKTFLTFIEKIKTNIRKISKKQILTINFKASEHCEPSATLLLFAEIDRLINYNGFTNMKGVPPKDSKSHQAFTQIGLCKKLNMIPKEDISHTMAKYWRSVSSTKDNDKNTQEHFKYLKEEILKCSQTKSTLWEVIIEATGNCIGHAYVSKRGDGLVDTHRWWMFSQVNQEDKTLGVAVCDLGIGIPKSLPVKYSKEKISQFLAKVGLVNRQNDATLIQASIEIARSRIAENAGRGYGMQHMHSIIDQLNDGELSIHSNYGSYYYNPQKNESCILKKHKNSIGGTIIEWYIPIKEEATSVKKV